ncbi:Tm-1-like ATP-binding domain-containing protein [Lipingzhangella sp. LS1_29]|uniref:Tm-1-like ATP-binding domain-containing protein n=1 Tax=Lipingzhangella rawalii TaxID=2055835 RepID=A0ABU2H6J0_9ACTN|nr:Tm-1-like ATP-binding domain-containing protein [Lipingzhangella rawalii]MDS1270929.1 Tm-1-like ATP-binding domain-containing protein [Lipingzhangella rawalii]
MPTVVLLGTLDTKSAEYAFLRARLAHAGVDTLLIDCGVFETDTADTADATDAGEAIADISAVELAQLAGTSLDTLRSNADRGAAIAAMSTGAAATLNRLAELDQLDGVLALGGSGGTSIAAHAMRELPVGLPKLIVSTVASGDTRPYVGARDVTMMYSVVDIAGINRVSSRVLANAAHAMAGMVRAAAPEVSEQPLVAASMFGVTTTGVTEARRLLEAAGREVLVFHATGTGGQSMEALINDGYISGVLDLTTTELADELVGGVMSAGANRATVAARTGLAQVVSVGALDMVNFAAPDTVPHRFADRRLYHHNPQVTLMRTTPEECAELGRRLARRLNTSTGPCVVFLPLRGVSALSVEGQPFHDPEADAALFGQIRQTLDRDRVELVELDTDINDAAFAAAMAKRLISMTTRPGEGAG